MITDQYDNPLTTGTAMARDFYDIGLRAYLGGQFAAADSFARAIEADPGFALGYAALARCKMGAGDLEGARAMLAAAEPLRATLTARERAHLDCMATALAGDAEATRNAVQAHVRDWPRDALIAQLCTNVFGLIGFSGKVGREAELLAYTGALLPHYGQDWWMMSMHALAMCETGQADASLAVMEEALALNPHNANGAHFKAHALYEIGETAAGRAYLETWLKGYDRRSGLHGHLSWHAALWALQTGDTDAMWHAIDTAIGPQAGYSAPINVLTDTAAIYHRAEIAGLAVTPERWATLSAYAVTYFPDPGQSFADMHAALAHAMAGNGEALARLTDARNGFAADLLRPAARAWAAIARQDWAAAVAQLVPVLAESERIGGSRAQRDLLELAYVNGLMRLGRREEAERALARSRPRLAQPLPVAGLTRSA